MGLAYNHLTPCPSYVLNCQTKDQNDFENCQCSAEGMVFYTANCKELQKIRLNKNAFEERKRYNENRIVYASAGHVESIFPLDSITS